MSLFIRKPVAHLFADAEDSERGLKRTLNSWALIALGIGAIIGAGLFARTAAAAATHAGPAVTIGYIIAGVGCAFAGLCYAEFASMIPIAGSAYTYSYATMGEFIAWIIGWDLILEYGVGAATVSSYWSQYFNKFLGIFDLSIPYQWFHSPFEHNDAGVYGIINIPAIFILLLLTLVLIRGTKGSAMVNNIIVLVKVLIILIVVAIGWSYIRPENHTPYIPEPTKYTNPETGVTTNFGGIMGILGAAGIVFFAYIGFDAVSTAAQEAKNPKRSMPIGILGSLVICTILYILFSYVLTGVASTEDFRTHGKEASVTYAIEHLDGTTVDGEWHPKYGWLANLITIAILAGFSSVILVMLLGQSRVFFSMSRDGLVPKVFSDVHPKFRTPYKSNWIFFVMSALFAGFIPADVVGEMTSIGTLFAFILVCAGVWIMRVKHPEIPRQFKVPVVPLVSILGILVCAAMIFGLGWTNWARLFVWLFIGLIIYFTYSFRKSRLRHGQIAVPKDPIDPLNPLQ
ncbi:MAG TPA: amino acid permease [Chitinophagaceae bacterium]|jgi:APA family basic amino acid/polyamine antiporter|nr:amino acid permease [Chitinophagaceae bacterium]